MEQHHKDAPGRIRSTAVRSTVLLGAALLLLTKSGNSAEEWRPGKYMAQAVARVMGGVRGVSEKTDYGYDNGICVLGAYLSQGGNVNFVRDLEKGQKYAFLGGGADPAKDVDIEVFDPDDQKVAEDTEADAIPIVGFTPKRTGSYTIRLELPKSPQATFCGMAIMRDGGWDVPVDNLSTAVAKVIALGTKADELNKTGARFHQETNTWALFGTVLKQGEASTLSNMRFERRKHLIAVAGDNNAKDLDAYLLDPNGKTLVEDSESDATPVLEYTTGAHPSYGLRIENNKAGGAALVIATVLDL